MLKYVDGSVFRQKKIRVSILYDDYNRMLFLLDGNKNDSCRNFKIIGVWFVHTHTDGNDLSIKQFPFEKNNNTVVIFLQLRAIPSC